MLDIVSSGDNLQEKSKVYLLEKYEKKCLDILSVYILFNSVYVYIYTNHGKLDNIVGFW